MMLRVWVLLWCSSSAVLGADSIRLVQRIAPGRTTYCEQRWRVSLHTGDPNSSAVTTELLLGVLQTPRRTDVGTLHLRCVVDRVAVAFDPPLGGRLAADTDNPGRTPLDELLQRLVGHGFTVWLDVRQRAVEVRGLEALRAEIDPAWPPMRLLREVLSEPVVLGWYNSDPQAALAEGRRVQEGERWRRQTVRRFVAGARLRADFEYHLVRITSQRGRRGAELSFTARLEPLDARAVACTLAGGAVLRFDAGHLEGTARYDAPAARLCRWRMLTTLQWLTADQAASRVVIVVETEGRLMSAGRRRIEKLEQRRETRAP